MPPIVSDNGLPFVSFSYAVDLFSESVDTGNIGVVQITTRNGMTTLNDIS